MDRLVNMQGIRFSINGIFFSNIISAIFIVFSNAYRASLILSSMMWIVLFILYIYSKFLKISSGKFTTFYLFVSILYWLILNYTFYFKLGKVDDILQYVLIFSTIIFLTVTLVATIYRIISVRDYFK